MGREESSGLGGDLINGLGGIVKTTRIDHLKWRFGVSRTITLVIVNYLYQNLLNVVLYPRREDVDRGHWTSSVLFFISLLCSRTLGCFNILSCLPN